jgi:demethylmenaquinone methyltransferase / 2-methoxy-6-polyprenyl-1,4-benzoquinol methylase
MHDQDVAGREVGEEIFRPPAEAGHGLAFEPMREILRQRPAQVAAVNFHFGETRPLHHRLEAAPHRLDFREFWHLAGLGVADNMVKLRHIASLPAPRYGRVKRTRSAVADSAHFGSRKVPLARKQALVDDVFHSVAHRYDLMNDLMSLGLHRAWKDALVTAVNPPKGRPFALLDIAGGTGDVALRAIAAGGERVRATVCDINTDMLAVGRERAAARGLGAAVAFTEANAEALPFADRSFDAATIAFGIRNVPRIERALAEAFRVLKTGGHFLCLEFSAVDVPGLAGLYDFYSFNVIPALGRAVVGDADAYHYLVESIRRFPGPQAFAAMLRSAGFARVSHQVMSGGIVALHSGWRL